MEKLCRSCNKVKPLTEFYKKSNQTDGHQITCKICLNKYLKEYNLKKKNKKEKVEEQVVERDVTLMLIGVTKNDYCEMYRIMSKLGYNPELDIYPQFMEKWSLNVSNEVRKGPPNQFTYQDCKE